MRLDLSHPKILGKEERQGLYRQVFLTPEGRMVLDDLAQAAWFFHCDQSQSEFGAMMYRQGGRNLLLYIVSMIEEPKPEIIVKKSENKDWY